MKSTKSIDRGGGGTGRSGGGSGGSSGRSGGGAGGISNEIETNLPENVTYGITKYVRLGKSHIYEKIPQQTTGVNPSESSQIPTSKLSPDVIGYNTAPFKVTKQIKGAFDSNLKNIKSDPYLQRHLDDYREIIDESLIKRLLTSIMTNLFITTKNTVGYTYDNLKDDTNKLKVVHTKMYAELLKYVNYNFPLKTIVGLSVISPSDEKTLKFVESIFGLNNKDYFFQYYTLLLFEEKMNKIKDSKLIYIQEKKEEPFNLFLSVIKGTDDRIYLRLTTETEGIQYLKYARDTNVSNTFYYPKDLINVHITLLKDMGSNYEGYHLSDYYYRPVKHIYCYHIGVPIQNESQRNNKKIYIDTMAKFSWYLTDIIQHKFNLEDNKTLSLYGLKSSFNNDSKMSDDINYIIIPIRAYISTRDKPKHNNYKEIEGGYKKRNKRTRRIHKRHNISTRRYR